MDQIKKSYLLFPFMKRDSSVEYQRTNLFVWRAIVVSRIFETHFALRYAVLILSTEELSPFLYASIEIISYIGNELEYHHDSRENGTKLGK